MSVLEEPAVAAEGPATAAPEKKKEPSLGRNRDFLLLWTGAGMSFLGSRVSAIAYTLLVYWSTGSATKAGLVTFAALLPNLVVQLPAGALVDRWDRRWTMIICDIGRTVAIATVLIAVLSGHVWLYQLMVVAFLESSMSVFYRLSERAAVRNVVPRSQLNAALAGNEARGQAAGLLGQPAGTFLYAATHWAPFGFTVGAHLASLVTLLFIRKDLQGERPDKHKPPRIVARVVEGFRFVWSQKYLKRALLLIAASNLLFQVLSLGLIVIVKQSGGSPSTIGFIIMVNGIGGMLGAITSNFFMKNFGIRRIIMGANLSWALLMPLFAFTTNPIALAAIYSTIIYGAGVANVAGMVYQVKTTPDNMQGRVGSISALLASGTNSLGAITAGFVLDAFSTTTTMLIVGGFMAALALVSVLFFGGRKAARLEKEMDLNLAD